jgi:hypothetical protein
VEKSRSAKSRSANNVVLRFPLTKQITLRRVERRENEKN